MSIPTAEMTTSARVTYPDRVVTSHVESGPIHRIDVTGSENRHRGVTPYASATLRMYSRISG